MTWSTDRGPSKTNQPQLSSGNTIIQYQGINVSTRAEIYRNDDRIYGIFGNKSKNILLPDEVKEKVLERLRMNDCNCSMELDEQARYEVRTEKRAKLLNERESTQNRIRQFERNNRLLYFGHKNKGYLGDHGKWEPNEAQNAVNHAFRTFRALTLTDSIFATIPDFCLSKRIL